MGTASRLKSIPVKQLRQFGCTSTAVCNTSGSHRTTVKTLFHDHHRRRISELLNSDGWPTLLDQELNSGRLDLSPRSIISILQSQESPFPLLKFYLWASAAAAPSLSKNRRILDVLRHNLVRTGPIVLSPEILREIRTSGHHIGEETLCALVESWGRLGLGKYCVDVFSQISFLGLTPSTRLYNSAIDALVRSNSLDLAYLRFHQMPSDGCTPDRFTYNTLIHGVCSAGVVDEALRLLRRMEVSGIPPNSHTFSILINGFCNSGEVEAAFAALRTMTERGIRSGEAAFGALIRGVFHHLTPVRAAVDRISAFLDGEEPLPLPVCDLVLACLSERSMPEEAALFLKKVEGRGYVMKDATFNVVMSCFHKGLGHHHTCQVFDGFTAKGGLPGLHAYLSLMESEFRSGRPEEGERRLKEMAAVGLVPNVFSYNAVIGCLVRVGMAERAAGVLEEMKERGVVPNSVSFNTLIAGFCRAGDTARARKMLLDLLELKLDPDVHTFGALIDGLCRTRRLSDAFECHAEMEEWGVRPNAVTFNILVKAACDAGEVGKAVKLSEKMTAGGVRPDVYTFNAIIGGFCKGGMVEEARGVLGHMVGVGVRPDNYTYSAIIRALCGSGRTGEAKEMYRSMGGLGCIPDSYTTRLLELASDKS